MCPGGKPNFLVYGEIKRDFKKIEKKNDAKLVNFKHSQKIQVSTLRE